MASIVIYMSGRVILLNISSVSSHEAGSVN